MSRGYPLELNCLCGAVWFGTARRKAFYEDVLSFWRIRHKDVRDEYSAGHGWTTTHAAARIRASLPPERMAVLERDEAAARSIMRTGNG